ncbi:hypothetical protein B7R54_08935 [Subtercola boreus]|uniref:Uncharacterized protein n=1 Tax=Subtercola boreus TaxID=120213 RepID=A0A3E0VI01_9MICO|nr:sigma-70 family RNA polymerase sigma factor [Subtercola boreus]RFA09341.1 hypothetical protein B7R54_08935 [Subtercola boreus]TQL53626.1 RNA polymerase sigma-70 factor (ECF subfamily) [Subtercola boreus]
MTTQTSLASFSAMYRQTYAEVLRFVRRRAHPLAVDDIVSETFTIAWAKRDALPREPLPWLYNTARNVMLNAARAGERQKSVGVRLAGFAETYDSAGIGSGVGASEASGDVADIERRIDLAAAFTTLSAVDQEVLTLDAWEDLDAKSAAQTLGCSRATYAMRLTRARRRLAALLRETPEPADAPFVLTTR